MDRKHMMIEKLERKDDWKEFAENFVEYLEEVEPNLAMQLQKAQRHPEAIDPTYPTPQDRSIAHFAHTLMKRFIREPDGRKLVRTMKTSKNPYETWRLLWFHYQPMTHATEAAETRILLHPPRIPDIKSVVTMLQRWEEKLGEFADRTGDEAMNENTKRELMISMMLDKVQQRLRDVLELNPKASIAQLRAVLVQRVRYIMGTLESDKLYKDPNKMDLDYFDENGGAWGGDEEWPEEPEEGGDQLPADSFGWKPKGLGKGKRQERWQRKRR